MRPKRALLLMLFLPAALVAGARPGDANSTPLETNGATIAPRTDTEVRLVREEIDVAVGRSDIRVGVSFCLRNEGGAADLEVGFPLDDGQTPQEFRAVLVSETPPGEREIPIVARPGWFAWPMRFAPGEDVHLRVSYRQINTAAFGTPFRYILRTGAAWRGTIGQASIRVRFPGRHRHEITWAVPEGYHFDGSTLAWDLSDFEPDFDIAFCWKQCLSVLYTDRALPTPLGAPLPEDLEAWPGFVYWARPPEARRGEPPVTGRREGDALVLRGGATVAEVRDGERQVRVDGIPRELPGPVRVSTWSVELPLGLLCELGWRQARYFPAAETLVVSSRGLNADEGAEPLLQRWHRTPRPASRRDFLERVAALEAGGLPSPERRFEHAELCYYAGDVDRAREGFAACTRGAPPGEWADLGRFWEAICLAHREDYRAAVACMERIPAGTPLSCAARLEAAEWLRTHDDLYALPKDQDRLAHALALARDAWRAATDPDLGGRAAVQIAHLHRASARDEQGGWPAEAVRAAAAAAEQTVRACIRRFPGHDAVLPLLLDWLQPYEHAPRQRCVALELIAAHFPTDPRARRALRAHLANRLTPRPNDWGYSPELTARLRAAVERLPAASPPEEDAAAGLRLAARRWLGQKVSEADARAARLREARAVPRPPGGGSAFHPLIEEALKRGDTAGARRIVAEEAWASRQPGITLDYWEERLAVAEGRYADALRLVERGLLRAVAYQVEDHPYLDMCHARAAELLLKLGRLPEAAQRLEEAYADAIRMERRYHEGGCRIRPEFYRAGAAVLRAQDPAGPRTAAFAALSELPPYASYEKRPAPDLLARLETLVRRFSREPLAWFALGEAHRLRLMACEGRYRRVKEYVPPLPPPDQAVVDDWPPSCRRLPQAWGRALELDPLCGPVLARLPEEIHGNRLDAPARARMAGWIESALRRRPEDARLRLALVRWYEKAGGSPDRLRAHREALLQAVERGWRRGQAVLSPMEDDLTILAEQYRALGRDPALAAVRTRLDAPGPGPGPEPRTPEEVAAAIARLEPKVFTGHSVECLELGRLYEGAGRPRDAARVYRLGLARSSYRREEFRKALAALPADAVADEANTR